jgi:hypothetical protein
MEIKNPAVVEETTATEEPSVETSIKTYTQEQVDDITQKVRNNAENVFVQQFGFKTADELKTQLETLKAAADKVAAVEKEYKVKEIRNTFINDFGGRADAVETLIAAKPDLLSATDVKVALSTVKKENPFFFNADKTVINVDRPTENGSYYYSDLKIKK